MAKLKIGLMTLFAVLVAVECGRIATHRQKRQATQDNILDILPSATKSAFEAMLALIQTGLNDMNHPVALTMYNALLSNLADVYNYATVGRLSRLAVEMIIDLHTELFICNLGNTFNLNTTFIEADINTTIGLANTRIQGIASSADDSSSESSSDSSK